MIYSWIRISILFQNTQAANRTFPSMIPRAQVSYRERAIADNRFGLPVPSPRGVTSSPNQSWLACSRFPALRVGYMYLLRVLIESLDGLFVIGQSDSGFRFSFTTLKWKAGGQLDKVNFCGTRKWQVETPYCYCCVLVLSKFVATWQIL